MLISTFNFHFPLHLWVYLGFQDDSYIHSCIHIYTVYIFPFAGLPDSWLYNTIIFWNSVLTNVRAGTALPPSPPTFFLFLSSSMYGFELSTQNQFPNSTSTFLPLYLKLVQFLTHITMQKDNWKDSLPTIFSLKKIQFTIRLEVSGNLKVQNLQSLS